MVGRDHAIPAIYLRSSAGWCRRDGDLVTGSELGLKACKQGPPLTRAAAIPGMRIHKATSVRTELLGTSGRHIPDFHTPR